MNSFLEHFYNRKITQSTLEEINRAPSYAESGMERHFALFLGFERSGSTLLGQIVNAHQNALIGNEGLLFEYLPYCKTQKDIFDYIHYLNDKFAKQKYFKQQKTEKNLQSREQNLLLAGGYQSNAEKIEVIGNAKAGRTPFILSERREQYLDLLSKLDMPIKFISIVRHPVHMIDSSIKRRGISPKEAIYNFQLYSSYLENALTYLETQNSVLNIEYEQLISEPQRSVEDIYKHLELSVDEAFIKNITQSFDSSPLKRKSSPSWLAEFSDEINSLIEKYSFFSSYKDTCL